MEIFIIPLIVLQLMAESSVAKEVKETLEGAPELRAQATRDPRRLLRGLRVVDAADDRTGHFASSPVAFVQPHPVRRPAKSGRERISSRC